MLITVKYAEMRRRQMKITDTIKYVGVNDETIDLFEGQYRMLHGVSYNSYVILDEKIAIMDTVDRRATEEWLSNLERVLEGRTPDYLIVSHMEPDHAANIQRVAEKYPEMKLVGNAKTFPMIAQFFDLNIEGREVIVKEGDTLSLGRHTLQFFMAPMVHWPEVMAACFSPQMASVNLEVCRLRSRGRMRQEDILSILSVNMVLLYRRY